MSGPTDSMTPFEYFEHLRREWTRGEASDLAADVGDVLAANILAALPDNQRNLLDRIHVGVLPTKTANAMVIGVPAGGEIIAVNYGLMSLLLGLNKVLLCRLDSLGFEPCLSLGDAESNASEIVRSLHGDVDSMPRWPVSPGRMLLASGLTNIQISFVVGHELGHSLLGHLRTARSNKTLGVEELITPHAMESAADERSGELVLAAFARSHNPLLGPMDKVVAQAGMDIFFTYFEFMIRVLGWPNSTETHPPPHERKKSLRKRFWDEMPEQARVLASKAEKLFQGFSATVS